MISTRISRRLLGTSAMLAGTVIAVVGLVPTLAAAEGGDIGPQGRLIVEKTVEGQTAATFGFHVTCDDGFDRTFTLDANSSKEFDGIWTGSVCVVTETDDGGADSTTVTPPDGTVVVDETGDAGPVTVSFVNVFDPPTTTTTTTTTTTMAPTTTTTTTEPTVLGVSITAPPAPLVVPAELPRTGNSTTPTLVTTGLALTVLGIALRRKATRSAATIR